MLYIQTLGKKFKTFRLVHDGKSPLIFKIRTEKPAHRKTATSSKVLQLETHSLRQNIRQP